MDIRSYSFEMVALKRELVLLGALITALSALVWIGTNNNKGHRR